MNYDYLYQNSKDFEQAYSLLDPSKNCTFAFKTNGPLKLENKLQEILNKYHEMGKTIEIEVPKITF